ncbi:FHA domain-containing protein [Antarctobacter heliothermus]|uniref:FHA domain-containing protein n=1 Tax=Antarctobacter heliothermus TaxID=74033 RepID=A0A239IJE2_9RHOB|nr:FHA domain-containing protein [Antarctobacter heliothermus]SNS93358.1 FHA domain-containing protein [Antarctobacter heliothermus]
MQGIRNLIARRRPVSDPAPETNPEPQVDPWEELHARVATTPGLRTFDKDSARAARDHIPRPERPQPSPRREWEPSGSDPECAFPTEPGPATLDDCSVDRLDGSAVEPLSATRTGGAPKIWDLEPSAPAAAPVHSGVSGALHTDPAAAPSPLALSAAGLAASPDHAARPASERVKTRLLGFHTEAVGPDPFAAPAASGTASAPRFPIGWIVVIDGPGRGASFTLTAGLSTVGRDADQTVTLDFGDTSISRERHISIAHDDEDSRTYIGHGGKSNIVRHNDRPLLTTEELSDGDTVRIGKTVLRFVGLCGDGFSWVDTDAPVSGND